MEKSLEKSQQQADIISIMRVVMIGFDVAYCREAATEMLNDANFAESAEKFIEKGWDEEKQMYYYLVYFNNELKK